MGPGDSDKAGPYEPNSSFQRIGPVEGKSGTIALKILGKSSSSILSYLRQETRQTTRLDPTQTLVP